MREIKFRAWDKFNHEMSEPFSLVDLCCSYPRTTEGEDMYISDCKIMQYTGIKDIYEGDIVTWGNKIALVIWDENTCSFKLLYKNEKYNLWLKCEVVGNMFENPNLIDNIN